MSIRKAVKSDRDALVGMINASGNLSVVEKECAAELLDIYLDNSGQKDYSFIVETDDKNSAMGYACYGMRPLTEGTYDLYWIVVDSARRRSGVGARLIDAVLERLKAAGARILVAETSGTKEYEDVMGFYLKNGFALEARVKEFYKPGDDLMMFVRRF